MVSYQLFNKISPEFVLILDVMLTAFQFNDRVWFVIVCSI